MNLLSYNLGGERHVGFLDDRGRIAPIALEAGGAALSPIRRLLEAGDEAMTAAIGAATAAFDGNTGLVTLEEVVVDPLVPDPEKILCVGFNYVDHITEMAVDLPSEPNIFAKFRNSLAAHGAEVSLPTVSTQIDYEGELAIVIGRRCKGVRQADALDYVAGYTALNDISARDLQFQTTQYTLGKAVDGFAPIGPTMALARDVVDWRALRITTKLNGETMQDEAAGAMIYSIEKIIEAISAVITLIPGDIIATGTPAGVGWKRNPPRFLAKGDVVEVAISDLRTLRTTIVQD